MKNYEIRKIIEEETARLPVNVEFRVTFHRNSAYIYGEERVRRTVRECVDYAISNVSTPKVHQVPTAEAVESIKTADRAAINRI